MKIGIIILLISFMFDGLISNFIPYQINNIFFLRPMFTVISLILIYPYFNKEDDKFYKVATLCGFFYDIVYTNTLPLNTFIFLLLALSIKLINNILSNNIINVVVMTIIIIIIFELCNFLILNVINYTAIGLYEMIYKIANSIFANTLYALILYLILRYISKKYKIKYID